MRSLDQDNKKIDSILTDWNNVDSYTNWRSTDVSVILNEGTSYSIRRAKAGKESDFLHECQVLKYLWGKKFKHLPRFIWIGERLGIPVAIQEYVPWSPLGDQRNLEAVDYEPVIDGLIELNSVHSENNSWGKLDWVDPDKWSFWNFEDYLRIKYTSKIQISPYLSREDVSLIQSTIEQGLAGIRDEIKARKPAMTHGDANPWNIIVNEHWSARWIDCWEARYSVPEEDFARLSVFEPARTIAPKLISRYSEKSWNPLNLGLIRLFRLCTVARRLSREKLTPWESEWKTLLLDLLQPIE